MNLLNNAIKFTERGEVTLRANCLSDRLVIEVCDTGIGIQAEDIPSLFVAFRQIDSGLTRQHEGTGLGLAICRRLSELLGAELSVSSHWGSTFKLELPQGGPHETSGLVDRGQ